LIDNIQNSGRCDPFPRVLASIEEELLFGSCGSASEGYGVDAPSLDGSSYGRSEFGDAGIDAGEVNEESLDFVIGVVRKEKIRQCGVGFPALFQVAFRFFQVSLDVVDEDVIVHSERLQLYEVVLMHADIIQP